MFSATSLYRGKIFIRLSDGSVHPYYDGANWTDPIDTDVVDRAPVYEAFHQNQEKYYWFIDYEYSAILGTTAISYDTLEGTTVTLTGASVVPEVSFTISFLNAKDNYTLDYIKTHGATQLALYLNKLMNNNPYYEFFAIAHDIIAVKAKTPFGEIAITTAGTAFAELGMAEDTSVPADSKLKTDYEAVFAVLRTDVDVSYYINKTDGYNYVTYNLTNATGVFVDYVKVTEIF